MINNFRVQNCEITMQHQSPSSLRRYVLPYAFRVLFGLALLVPFEGFAETQAQKLIASHLFKVPIGNVESLINADYNPWGSPDPASNTPGYIGGHSGIDIQTKNVVSNQSIDVPFYAVSSGEVINAGNSSANTIAIYSQEYNETVLYLHARRVEPLPQFVSVGTRLGIQGNEGPVSFGVHVHIEVRPGRHTSAASGAVETANPEVAIPAHYLNLTFAPPIISEVAQGNVVFGQVGRQWITLRGNFFYDGFCVEFRDEDRSQTYAVIAESDRLRFVNTREVAVYAGVGDVPANWSATVIGRGGARSNKAGFSVIAACPGGIQQRSSDPNEPCSVNGPFIGAVGTGNRVVGSPQRQWIPISGDGFTSGFTATFRDVTNSETYPEITDSGRLRHNGPTSVDVFAGVGDDAAVWEVIIHNPNGSNSNAKTFTVVPPGGWGQLAITEIVIDDNQSTDSSGNDNETLDAGEVVGIRIYLENTGGSPMTNAWGELLSSDGCISISSAAQDWGGGSEFLPGEEERNDDEFVVRVSSNCPVPKTVDFVLRLHSDQGIIDLPFSLTVQGNFNPNVGMSVAFDGVGVDDNDSADSTGNNNEQLDAGELVALSVFVENTGAAPLTGIVGTLSTSDPCVTISDGTQAWAASQAMLPGEIERNAQEFTLDIAESCNVPHTVQFNLSLTSDQGTQQVQFSLEITGRYSTAGCVATLIEPATNAQVALAQEFTWDLEGPSCPAVRLIFATSSNPTTVAFSDPLTQESLVVDQAFWNQRVLPAIGTATEYWWTIDEADGALTPGTPLAPWRRFDFVPPCVAELLSPEAETTVTIPQLFRWQLQGPSCPPVRLIFATSNPPMQVAFTAPLTQTAVFADQQFWNTVVLPVLGSASEYWWTVDEADGALTPGSPLAPWRRFDFDATGGCSAQLLNPAANATITETQTFSWSLAGSSCPPVRLIFANPASPEVVAFTIPLTDSSLTTDEAFWHAVVFPRIGASGEYWWTVDEADGALTPGQPLAAWRRVVFQGPFDISYSAWRRLTFDAATRDDDSISGFNADADNDGIINGMEFSLVLNPHVSDARYAAHPIAIVTRSDGKRFFSMRYRKRRGAALQFSVGVSTNLQDWDYSSDEIQVIETRTSSAGSFDIVTVVCTREVALNSAIFLNLKVDPTR
jgi:hypothetical protein